MKNSFDSEDTEIHALLRSAILFSRTYFHNFIHQSTLVSEHSFNRKNNFCQFRNDKAETLCLQQREEASKQSNIEDFFET